MHKSHSLGLLFVFICILNCTPNNTKSLNKTQAQRISISDSLPSSSEITNFIEPYKTKIDADIHKPLSWAKGYYSSKDGELNSSLGNLMADIVFERSNWVASKRGIQKVDFVLLNKGGIRAPMHKGVVTKKTAYNIMPFENKILLIALTKNGLEELIQFLSSRKIAHPISGIALELNKNGDLMNAFIQGKPIDFNTTYWVATSDYLFNGGDHMNFFQKNSEVIDLDYKIRNAMIDYFEEKDTLITQPDQRFSIK